MVQMLTRLLVKRRNWLEVYPKDLSWNQAIFNLYLNDLFYLAGFTEFCNFRDNKTFDACDNDLNNLIKRLEHDAFLAIEYFETNNIKLNKEKCHRLVSRHNYENVWVKMGDKKKRNLYFDDHLILICKKARKKTSSVSKII